VSAAADPAPVVDPDALRALIIALGRGAGAEVTAPIAGVPPHVADVARSVLRDCHAGADAPIAVVPVEERRHKHILRDAMVDLWQLAARIEASGVALAAVTPVLAPTDALAATEESVSLKLLAGDLQQLAERILRRERAMPVLVRL
jgi:hypothetical protein